MSPKPDLLGLIDSNHSCTVLGSYPGRTSKTVGLETASSKAIRPSHPSPPGSWASPWSSGSMAPWPGTAPHGRRCTNWWVHVGVGGACACMHACMQVRVWVWGQANGCGCTPCSPPGHQLMKQASKQASKHPTNLQQVNHPTNLTTTFNKSAKQVRLCPPPFLVH